MSQWNVSRRKPLQSAVSPTGFQQQVADVCLKVTDWGLAAVIFAGPFLFGGRHLAGRFAILTLCVVTAVAWFVRQVCLEKPSWIRTPGTRLLIAAIAWVAFQIMPLPSTWLVALAPSHGEILPLWNTQGSNSSLGTWQTISVSPEDTRLALAALIAYSLLFVTAVQRMETLNDVERVARWIAGSAIIVAAFGILQHFTANGKFFWIYEYPYAQTTGHLKAGFTGRNPFAHFLVLGLANLVAWILLHRTRDRNGARRRPSQHHFASKKGASQSGYVGIVLIAAATLLVFAILASLSRGAALAMVCSLGVAAALYARGGLLSSGHFLCGATLVLVLIGTLSFSGNYEEVAQRLESLTANSAEKVDVDGGRRKIWSANVAAFQASWMTGWGAGSHRFVYPLYLGESTPQEYTHAENGYLQIASEHGLPGLVMLAVGMMSCGWWCWRAFDGARGDQRQTILLGGVAAGLVASAVHSVVDFVWFIPACMAVTVLLAACALRLAQLATPRTQQAEYRATLAPITRTNMALATVLAGTWAIATLYPAAKTSFTWDTYLHASQAISLAANGRLPADGHRREVSESEELNSAVVLESLAQVVRDYPNSTRAHLRMADALLKRFELLQLSSANAMTIGQIRDAAIASNFPSSHELHDWLRRAFSDSSKLLYMARRHAVRALELCPLEGEAYLFLAELVFLEGRGADAYSAYADQALRVRPDDPSVLFAIGNTYFLASDLEACLPLWARAYRSVGNHRRAIIAIMSQQITAGQFLAAFEPDWSSLPAVWAVFKQTGTIDDLQTILPYAQDRAPHDAAACRPVKASRLWFDLSQMQLEMYDAPAALASLQRAYTIDPDSYVARRHLGRSLLSFDQFEAAETHLRWCLVQRPADASIQRELLQATRGKMQQIARSTYSTIQ